MYDDASWFITIGFLFCIIYDTEILSLLDRNNSYYAVLEVGGFTLDA